jgi:cyclase
MEIPQRTRQALIAAALLFSIAASIARPHAQQHGVDLETIQLRPDFWMIAGAGANIAVQAGPDGVLLVDAGSQDAAVRVLPVITRLTDRPIRYIIDTSADRDHVGGNGTLARAGRSIFAAGPDVPVNEFARAMTNGFAATIVAFEAVLLRMSAPTGKTAPFPSESWPVETFADRRRDIYFNQQGIQIFHEPTAHSEGDLVVFFRRSDVIAAGDVIDATKFPVIDVDRGASVQGEIDALNHVIELSVRSAPFPFQGGGTYIIPGHGRVYDKDDVVEYRDMIVIIRDIIQNMIEQGMTIDQIKAAAPARAYDRQYGAMSGAVDRFVEAVYKSLVATKS